MPKQTISPYQHHVNKWKDCNLCESCKHRKNVVLFRGSIPASVLFCGEAPGPSEDVLNKPFSGPSGKLLDSIIDDAKTISGMNSLTIGLTNLVGCIPRGDDLRKFGEPSPESIEACLERLDEIIALCSPSLIVSVGKLAKENLKGLEAGYHLVNIVHPAAIMRADISQQKLMVKNATIILADAFEDCFASV